MKKDKKWFSVILTISLCISGFCANVFGARDVEASQLELDEATELQIRTEYAAMNEVDVNKVSIIRYLGNYSGKEVFKIIWRSDNNYGQGVSQDINKFIRLGGYMFILPPEGFYGYFCWEPGSFMSIEDACKEGILSHQDIRKIGIMMGQVPEQEELPYNDVDISNDWFGESVYDMFAMNLMTGMDEETFAPYSLLSRAQFATIMLRMEEPIEGYLNVLYKDIFGDVKKVDWFMRGVLWSAENGIVTGYENGCFGPVDSITREQLAVMLYRYAKYKGHDVSNSIDLQNYPDASDVSDFAKEAMSWCVAEGIISGNDGKLLPQGNATRAECAAMISRYMEIYG